MIEWMKIVCWSSHFFMLCHFIILVRACLRENPLAVSLVDFNLNNTNVWAFSTAFHEAADALL